MCGFTLVCPETGKNGFICKCVYIIEELDIDREFYISITLDRKKN
jgi:succinyl-CoA synthetase beta subunit